MMCDHTDHVLTADPPYCQVHDCDLVDGKCPDGEAAAIAEERRSLARECRDLGCYPAAEAR